MSWDPHYLYGKILEYCPSLYSSPRRQLTSDSWRVPLVGVEKCAISSTIAKDTKEPNEAPPRRYLRRATVRHYGNVKAKRNETKKRNTSITERVRHSLILFMVAKLLSAIPSQIYASGEPVESTAGREIDCCQHVRWWSWLTGDSTHSLFYYWYVMLGWDSTNRMSQRHLQLRMLLRSVPHCVLPGL